MTVITLPSTGVKSDKVLLVDLVDVCESQREQDFNHSMSATFNHPDPKNLESGEKEPIAVSSAKMLAIKKLVLCLLIFALVLVLSMSIDMKCKRKGYHKKIDAEHQQQDMDMDITDVDAAVPYKSYESYAAAESDIMSLQPLPSSLPFEADDYDAGQLSAIDGLYKKLINNAFDTVSDTSNSARDSEVDRQKGDNNSMLPIPEMKSTRFIHDFSINVTGIVDVDKQCCFVLPLMRSPASKSFYDLLLKMSTGYFAVDIKEIMGNMRIVKPPLKDLSDYGLYISKDCANYSTFKLEKCDDTVTAATTMVAVDTM